MTRTTKPSAFRRWVTAVLVVLGITFGSVAMATPASAHPPGNIYNNSDHGMWFTTSSNQTPNNNAGPLKWVPAKTWSSHVGVVATGIYVGTGYCARIDQSNGRGGWAFNQQVRGLSRPWLNANNEWLVYEWRC